MMQAFAFVWPRINQIVVWGIITLALQLWIVFLMWRKKLARRFPVFFSYIVYQIAEGIFRWIVQESRGTGSSAYYWAYWRTEIVEVLFLFCALGESSWHLFRSFRKLRWFWRLFAISILITLAYGILSAWVGPPRGMTRAMSLVTRLDLIATFMPAGVAVLYFGLVFRLPIWEWFSRESWIIMGLAIMSSAGILMMGLRSYFGRPAFGPTTWIAAWGYILAEVLWIREFLRPDPPGPSKEDMALLRSVMEQVNEALDRYSGALKEAGKSK